MFYTDRQQYYEYDRTININQHSTKDVGLWLLTSERTNTKSLFVQTTYMTGVDTKEG